MRTAVLTISTSVARREAEDASGPLLAHLAEEAGADVESHGGRPRRLRRSSRTACTTTSTTASRFVFTTGGTGLTPDDVTPEATRAVIEREAPGIAEAMRADAPARTPRWACSRAASAGIAHRTLIVNFPGSPKAIERAVPA